MKQLGDVLLERGLATPEQVYEAGQEQRRVGRSMGRVLVDQGVISEADLVRALAAQIGLDYVDLGDALIDPSATALVPGAVCRRHMLVPVRFVEGKLVIAMADPANVIALDDVRSIAKVDLKPVVSTRGDVMAAIARAYRAGDELDSLSTAIEVRNTDEEDLTRIKEVVEEAPIVKFVNLLITQGIQDGASDIHIEPAEHDLRVRFRIDGVLHEVMRSPKSIQSGVTSRLKIMADINIAERRIPQDGRLSVNAYGRKVDLRVATLPTVWGEKVVMRILDNSTAMLDLKDLGFTGGNFDRYQTSYLKPYGMILVTGPTGSGKSTTLYSTLHQINKPEVNIITVEDPVEYRLPGINQVQTNAKAGLTFAAALRSILRADPDVVLIGEIRDHETAQIAIEASLTGHLVLATLHTNDAPSAVTRLIEMGIEPFLVGLGAGLRAGPAAGAAAVQQVQGALHADAGDPDRRPLPVEPGGAGADAVPRCRVRRVRQDRVQGAVGAARGDERERGRRAADRRAGVVRGDRERRARRGHGLAAPGRDAQGGHGDHVAGRDPARGGVTLGGAPRLPRPRRTAAPVHRARSRFRPSLGRLQRFDPNLGRLRGLKPG